MNQSILSKIKFILPWLLLTAGSGFADTAPAPKIDSGDTAWLLTSTALVLLMTIPALALFYGGMVRKKNILSTIYYSLGSALIVSILWVTILYPLAFGADVKGIIGSLEKAFMNGITTASIAGGNIPEFVFVMFQMTFAIITVALISGSIVERMRFSAWFLFVIVWTLIVYSPLAHWVWGGGWLQQKGALDFAGGLVVHISSGVSGLVAAIYLGPRTGYKNEPIRPNNIPFTFIGAAMLWIGWFGFNAGSSVAANGLAGSAFLVTNTAAAMAAITWLALEWMLHGKPSLIGASSGLVAGLVAITPAAGFVDVKAALIIGMLSSVICYFMVAKAKKALGYDDALDAFGIHGIGGIFGAIATGFLANPSINSAGTGLLYGNPGQVLTQLMSIGVAIGLAVIGTLISLLKIFF